MPRVTNSLLGGRNRTELTEDEIRRASNTFLGLESGVNTRYVPNAKTAFCVRTTDTQNHYGEIVIGPDIYPGSSVIDPNSALSLDAAAAHELTHYHRWKDKAALSEDELKHLDEALTSLQAIARYYEKLNDSDIQHLAADAVQRIHLFLQQQMTDLNNPLVIDEPEE